MRVGGRKKCLKLELMRGDVLICHVKFCCVATMHCMVYH